MSSYNNLTRSGMKTSQAVNPRWIVEDISYEIQRLDPEGTPFLNICEKFSKGKAPSNHKIMSVNYDALHHWDVATFNAIGTTDGTRFARITVANKYRPNANTLLFNVQDKIAIPKTGQVLEVVITPTASAAIQSGTLSVADTLTGNTGIGNRTTGNSIVVRNTVPQPIIPFTTTDIVWLGRTIAESQRIGATPLYSDVWYDYNFVEHKEAVLHMTEDAMEMIKTRGSVSDWVFEQQELIKRFKRDVDYTLIWSERSYNADQPGRPTRHMRGLMNWIDTNVTYYNPFATDNFEILLLKFINRQAFRYSPNGRRKVGYCGRLFAENFSLAFKDYRRMTNADALKGKYGMNVQSYEFNGNVLDLVITDQFDPNTDTAHWLLIADPSVVEMRVKKAFETKYYELPDEREKKLMVEWQGSIAPHRSEAHALLRTA